MEPAILVEKNFIEIGDSLKALCAIVPDIRRKKICPETRDYFISSLLCSFFFTVSHSYSCPTPSTSSSKCIHRGCNPIFLTSTVFFLWPPNIIKFILLCCMSKNVKDDNSDLNLDYFGIYLKVLENYKLLPNPIVPNIVFQL